MKKIVINILIPIIVGGISALITKNSMDIYSYLDKPSFSPPSILFPIVWTILYLLMGVSSYLICNSDNRNKKSAYIIYGIQLFLNFIWSIVFFLLSYRLLSFIIIILLLISIIIMIIKFYKIDKKAGLLQIPYLLWVLFASILNLTIYLLNR